MGYTQIPVLQVDETFLFVVRVESLHLLLVLITLEDWHKLIQLLCSLRYLTAKGRDVNGAPTRFHGCWTGDPDLSPVEGVVCFQTGLPHVDSLNPRSPRWAWLCTDTRRSWRVCRSPQRRQRADAVDCLIRGRC